MTPETDAWTEARWWTERLEDPCFVYVIRAGGPIKVGVAKDVAARLATLQTGNPYRFELLHVLPGGHDLEWQLHKRIEGDRLEGEWFDGESISDFLAFVAEFADKLRGAYADDGVAPAWKKLIDAWTHRRRSSSRSGEVTVRLVEPDPVPPEVLRQRTVDEWMGRDKPDAHLKLHRYAEPE